MEPSSQLPVACYFNELSSKLEELKKVYNINSTLVKQRDEEIENLKQQVSTLTSQFSTVVLLLEKASSQLEASNAELQISTDECEGLRAELEDSDECLKREKLQKSRVEENLRLKEIELQYANDAVQEKTEEISELMSLLQETFIKSEGESNNNDSSQEDEVSEPVKEEESLEFKLNLSPIPEENIDDIPDYYDEWLVEISEKYSVFI